MMIGGNDSLGPKEMEMGVEWMHGTVNNAATKQQLQRQQQTEKKKIKKKKRTKGKGGDGQLRGQVAGRSLWETQMRKVVSTL